MLGCPASLWGMTEVFRDYKLSCERPDRKGQRCFREENQMFDCSWHLSAWEAPLSFSSCTFSAQVSAPRSDLRELPMPVAVQRAEEKLDLDTDTLRSHTDSVVQFKHRRAAMLMHSVLCMPISHQMFSGALQVVGFELKWGKLCWPLSQLSVVKRIEQVQGCIFNNMHSLVPWVVVFFFVTSTFGIWMSCVYFHASWVMVQGYLSTWHWLSSLNLSPLPSVCVCICMNADTCGHGCMHVYVDVCGHGCM